MIVQKPPLPPPCSPSLPCSSSQHPTPDTLWTPYPILRHLSPDPISVPSLGSPRTRVGSASPLSCPGQRPGPTYSESTVRVCIEVFLSGRLNYGFGARSIYCRGKTHFAIPSPVLRPDPKTSGPRTKNKVVTVINHTLGPGRGVERPGDKGDRVFPSLWTNHRGTHSTTSLTVYTGVYGRLN